MGEGFDGGGVEGADAFEDAGGDLGLFGVSGEDHFEAGVEVVDEMEGNGFRGFGFDRGAELHFAVVGGDEVEEVKADVFGGRGEGFPLVEREFAPEGVDEFDSDADVAEKFAS